MKKRINFEKGENNTLSIKFGRKLLAKIKLTSEEYERFDLEENNWAWKDYKGFYGDLIMYLHIPVVVTLSGNGAKFERGQPYIFTTTEYGIEVTEDLMIEEILYITKSMRMKFEDRISTNEVCITYQTELD